MTSNLQPLIRPELMPLSIARAIWKGKWLVIAIWIAISAGGYLMVRNMPSVYSAEALVLVDSQKIPEKYVTSTVDTDVRDRLASISRQILSTERLKKLITDLNLYPGQSGKSISDSTVDTMRKNIALDLDRGWSGGLTAFRVGFQGENARLVADVANRLSAFFVAENLRDREVQAEGTAEFIDSQLREAKARLDEQEAALGQYKAQHTGELPGQETMLLGTVGRLQAELQANTDAINRARQTKVLLENNLTLAEGTTEAIARTIESNSRVAQRLAAAAAEPVQAPSQQAAEIERLQGQLITLRLRYTDDHPDVVRTERTLQRLLEIDKQQPSQHVARSQPAGRSEGRAFAPGDSGQIAQGRERVQSIKAQITAADKELQARIADQEKIRQEMGRAQAKLDRVPFREQEMSSLTRDYDISKANYQSLLGKKLAAEMATDMERRHKSERFTIIDPARVPVNPIKPNRMYLRMLCSVAGMMLGIAAAVVNEARRNVLLGEWELPANTPVLGYLPRIVIGQDRTHGNPAQRAAWTSTANLMILMACAVKHWF